MDQKFAIIDLGTNTFHLLIAKKHDGKVAILHREKVGVKIGKAGINRDIIQPDALDRALNALQNFKAKIDASAVSSVHAFATSAFRNAANADEVTRRIKLLTDIDVQILSGDQEANMIYRGVNSALDLGKEISLIMDIGAGSVEFILASQEQAVWSRSLEIGAQRILEKFSISDPITPAEIENINRFLDQSLQEVNEAVTRFSATTLVGSSGSFDTLSDMYCLQNGVTTKDTDTETPLTPAFVYTAYQEIIQTTRAQRLEIPGMIELRVDLIVVGCCLVRYILEKHQIGRVRVSRNSLKEGALAMLPE